MIIGSLDLFAGIIMWICTLIIALFLHSYNSMFAVLPLLATALSFKARLVFCDWAPCFFFLNWWTGYSSEILFINLIFLYILENIQHQLSLDAKISRAAKLTLLLILYKIIKLTFTQMGYHAILLKFAVEGFVYLILLSVVNQLYSEQVIIFQH